MAADEWLNLLPLLYRNAAGAAGIEGALAVLTACAKTSLGDPSAAGREGSLKSGEKNYRVSGVFLIAPDRKYNVLAANQGFPPEQRRLSIPISWNHPGSVVASRRMLLLENTDDHEEFRQFLKTSRMGSSLYMPIMTEAGMIGQLVAAAQARWTYGQKDIAPMASLAAAAALLWEAKDGNSWWQADYPAADAWYADKRSV